MRRFLLFTILFFVIVLIIDVVFGVICNHLNNNARGGDTALHYTVTERQTAPILVLGSSRAFHHYDPDILADSLGHEVFNGGVDGNGIIFQYARLRMILDRYTPEMVIYDVYPDYDIAVGDNTRYLKWLRRWAGHHAVDSIVRDISSLEALKMQSGLYRYNESFIQMIGDNVSSGSFSDRNGFRPMEGTMDYHPDNPPASTDPVEWDPVKLRYFESMIDLCRSRGVKLTMVFSPYYGATSSGMFDNMISLCTERNVPVIDMFSDPDFSVRQDFFADPSHLNSIGAREFSRSVSSSLRPLLDE